MVPPELKEYLNTKAVEEDSDDNVKEMTTTFVHNRRDSGVTPMDVDWFGVHEERSEDGNGDEHLDAMATGQGKVDHSMGTVTHAVCGDTVPPSPPRRLESCVIAAARWDTF